MSEELARLIHLVKGLNPDSNEIGSGYMAQMKELAERIEEQHEQA